MALRDGDRHNFETLQRACRANDLALVECQKAETGEYVAVICAVGQDGEAYLMVPLATMIEGNPYDTFIPPGIASDPV